MAYINGNEILFSARITGTGRVLANLIGLIEGTIGDFEIPEGTTTIRNSCIGNCPSLTKITIPASVLRIGLAAFNNGTYLKNATFEGKPDNIAVNAFNSNLEHMVCPWKEGEVANAPWGAINATILYTG